MTAAFLLLLAVTASAADAPKPAPKPDAAARKSLIGVYGTVSRANQLLVEANQALHCGHDGDWRSVEVVNQLLRKAKTLFAETPPKLAAAADSQDPASVELASLIADELLLTGNYKSTLTVTAGQCDAAVAKKAAAPSGGERSWENLSSEIGKARAAVDGIDSDSPSKLARKLAGYK